MSYVPFLADEDDEQFGFDSTTTNDNFNDTLNTTGTYNTTTTSTYSSNINSNAPLNNFLPATNYLHHYIPPNIVANKKINAPNNTSKAAANINNNNNNNNNNNSSSSSNLISPTSPIRNDIPTNNRNSNTNTSNNTNSNTNTSTTNSNTNNASNTYNTKKHSLPVQPLNHIDKEEEELPFKDAVMFAMRGHKDVFEGLKQIRNNKFCIDCAEPHCGWASMYLGIFLCMNCAGVHRSLGSHVSYVRSVDLDRWTEEQLLYMILGGNKRLRDVFISNGIVERSLQERYNDEAVRKHRESLHVDVMEQSYRLEKMPRHILGMSPPGSPGRSPTNTSRLGSTSSTASLLSETRTQSSSSISSFRLNNRSNSVQSNISSNVDDDLSYSEMGVEDDRDDDDNKCCTCIIL